MDRREYEQPVMEELEEVKGRFDKLQTLLGSSCIPEDRSLLIRQSHIMSLYLDVLTERVSRFTSDSLRRAHQAQIQQLRVRPVE